MDTDAGLMGLLRAIVADDGELAARLVAASPQLATAAVVQGATRQNPKDYYFRAIGHYAYGGDTALHIAAAGHRLEIARMLVAAGSDVRARNRRGAEPLHYAADGHPGAPFWRPEQQAATVAILVTAGADPNAVDKSGVAPLHRAVRTRSSGAVKALLELGADARGTNASGSTPMKLALLTTGRGGSGSEEAKEQQAVIVRLLQAHGA
jgi:hypothetical protein